MKCPSCNSDYTEEFQEITSILRDEKVLQYKCYNCGNEFTLDELEMRKKAREHMFNISCGEYGPELVLEKAKKKVLESDLMPNVKSYYIKVMESAPTPVAINAASQVEHLLEEAEIGKKKYD